jgi:hypothetical protein
MVAGALLILAPVLQQTRYYTILHFARSEFIQTEADFDLVFILSFYETELKLLCILSLVRRVISFYEAGFCHPHHHLARLCSFMHKAPQSSDFLQRAPCFSAFLMHQHLLCFLHFKRKALPRRFRLMEMQF